MKFIYILKIYEAKYQSLVNKRERTEIEYSNDMDDIYKNIKEYNLNKNEKYRSYLI